MTPSPPPAPARRRRLLPTALLFVLVAGTLGVVFHRQALATVAGWLDVGQPPVASDFVLVLMGGEETRPFVAAALFRQGLAGEVLLSEVPHAEMDQPATARSAQDVAREVLVRRGVPAERITVLPGPARSTFDEAASLARFFRQRPAARVTVVTNGFHTRRARWIFHRVLGQQGRQVTFVSAPTDGYSASDWWHNENGSVLYIMELGKFAYYLLRYDPRWPWCAGALVLAVVLWKWRRRRTAAARAA